MATTTAETFGINPTHQEIAERARAIYESSGRIPGRDLDNWLQAEAELRRDRKPALTRSPKAAAGKVHQGTRYA